MGKQLPQIFPSLNLKMLWLTVPCAFKDNEKARKWITGYIDNKGFDRQVVFVSAMGFLTDSYALFATNVILPSLAYIYWPDATNGQNELTINCVTLAASVCGQALFGYWADRYGRRKLYGIELMIVIFGTLGMSQASTGTNQSMSIIWWIIFWRFFMGLGIGAEHVIFLQVPFSSSGTLELFNVPQAFG
jgi:PHS family inorganic phosphate transporter-like MFS transporter